MTLVKRSRPPAFLPIHLYHMKAAMNLILRPCIAWHSIGQTPLHHAIMGAWESCVALLLGRGADATSPDRWGRTPLILAALHDHEGIVHHLLARPEVQAWISHRDAQGMSARDYALRAGNARLAEQLESSGEDAAAEDGQIPSRPHVVSADPAQSLQNGGWPTVEAPEKLAGCNIAQREGNISSEGELF